MTDSQMNKYIDGEICLNPFGIVFAGKNKNGNPSKFFFQTSEIEWYTTAQYANLIIHTEFIPEIYSN